MHRKEWESLEIVFLKKIPHFLYTVPSSLQYEKKRLDSQRGIRCVRADIDGALHCQSSWKVYVFVLLSKNVKVSMLATFFFLLGDLRVKAQPCFLLVLWYNLSNHFRVLFVHTCFVLDFSKDSPVWRWSATEAGGFCYQEEAGECNSAEPAQTEWWTRMGRHIWNGRLWEICFSCRICSRSFFLRW